MVSTLTAIAGGGPCWPCVFPLQEVNRLVATIVASIERESLKFKAEARVITFKRFIFPDGNGAGRLEFNRRIGSGNVIREP
jgi:hypothetical protein